MDEVKLMQVIYCTKKRRGSGKTIDSPIRIVKEIFTTEGELLAENDSNGNFTIENLWSFALWTKANDDMREGCIDRWLARGL
jgi:hypothetical protein